MKSIRLSVLGLCSLVLLSGCGNLNNTAKGGIIGGAGGAALGGILGQVIGHNTKSTAIGAAIGTAVGATAGVLIGKKMDKAKAAAAAVENAQVESIKDANGLDAVKVTFDSGILFTTGSATLANAAKTSLTEFANVLKTYNDADVAIYGHTDNTGSLAVNQKLSKSRAEAVSDFLKSKGVAEKQIKEVAGFDFQQPVASNDTKEGRAQNRRVEVFLYASDEMRAAAEAGTLKE